MENDLDFLDGDTPAETNDAAPTPEAPPAPAAESPQGQERGPDGKFVAKAKETPAEPAPAAPAAPAAEAQPGPSQAPTPAAQPPGPSAEERLAKLEEENANLLRAMHAERNRRQEAQRQPPPDLYEDPEAYQAHVEHERRVEASGWSRRLAEATHGAETVQQAHAWAFERAQNDPVFAAQSYNHPDPYGFAVEQWNRDQAINLLSDPSNFAKFQAFLGGQAPSPAQVAPAAAPQQPPTPTRSLAAASSAGGSKPGEAPLDDESMFGATFKG